MYLLLFAVIIKWNKGYYAWIGYLSNNKNINSDNTTNTLDDTEDKTVASKKFPIQMNKQRF